MKNICSIQLLLLNFVTATFLFATNDLTVSRPGGSTTKAAYIDKAIIVIEPQGAYAEQSLYLTYSDHGGFAGYNNVEIKHRFELPPGSVINDLWLWIGDSIMQARILDTWTGRHIYDSIVNLARDPAYLFKNGDQYELRVFPLTGGSYRKVKLNIITPIRWTDSCAVLDLPLAALKASNNSVLPADILFRVSDATFGRPTIMEVPSVIFAPLTDTLGYKYTKTTIPNIKAYSTLKLSYNVRFAGGKYFQSREYTKGLNYFQYSLSLKDMFSQPADSSSKKVMVGMDFSGSFGKSTTNNYLLNVKNVLKSAIPPKDSFNILVTGGGKQRLVSDGWMAGAPAKIDSALTSVLSGAFFDTIMTVKKPTIRYADSMAVIGWSFNGIPSYAATSSTTNLKSAVQNTTGTDVIASYKHSWINVPSNADLAIILDSLNVFFQRGGKFISYFNLDCNTSERVVRNYMPTLRTTARVITSTTLYRDITGNFGKNFPEYFDHIGKNLLQYDDTTVKVEVKDAQGIPVVVSKRIGNGLLIACGIWLFTDNDPTRALLAPPLLGINTSNTRTQLFDLLTACRSYQYGHPYSKLLLLSNCDSLVLKNDAAAFANAYYSGFANRPLINTINVLNENTITLPYQIANNITYTGAGLLLNKLSEKSAGIHFERKSADWTTIANLLKPVSAPRVDSLVISPSVNGDPLKIVDFMEIKHAQVTPDIPRNYIGSTRSSDSVQLSVTAKFVNNDTVFRASFSDRIMEHPGQSNLVKSSILGNEKIKAAFTAAVIDTAAIVGWCLTHRLLSDYSCFLALEPNDTNRFIKPFDESRLVSIERLTSSTTPITFALEQNYPNPFNASTNIRFAIPETDDVSLTVYDALGQEVRKLINEKLAPGYYSVKFDGGALPSGVYIYRLAAKHGSITRKMVLIK